MANPFKTISDSKFLNLADAYINQWLINVYKLKTIYQIHKVVIQIRQRSFNLGSSFLGSVCFKVICTFRMENKAETSFIKVYKIIESKSFLT